MKRAPSFGAASVVLFLFGSLLAVLYLTELLTDGDRASGFIEGAGALFAAAWLTGLLHLRVAANKRP
ncbi:hypothetical protein [Streptomyces rhizosphaerihabitans]|uniref:hypothetical protein n=1 Tax=Streptomyces rhizosphaerihabitans TaxID=1266770 RepID=UPI0021C0212A|nr:hypothetical protein [Streptomyces rhizosphaerihabitans]MCT9011290.1 hypothetical protein [Streptomyces rhizosphaerihabitans]